MALMDLYFFNIALDKLREAIYINEPKFGVNIFPEQQAEVAELVDALGSGSSRSIPVGVRVSPSAPNIGKAVIFGLQLFFCNPFLNGSDKFRC